MNKQFIIFMGPQGSGKSTQAKLLAEKLGFTFISSGEVLRGLKTQNDPRSPELEKYWLNGELIPNDLMYSILFPIFRDTDTKGFVIDGFPREIEQVHALLDFLDEIEANLSHAFYLRVGEEECIERIKLRIMEQKRLDESEEAIKKRLEIYHSQTEPLLEEYRRMGRLFELDGEQDVPHIHSDVMLHFSPILDIK